MTSPPELTDEIRQAVRDEDCARLGHQFQLENMLRGPSGPPVEVRGPDGQLPHLLCPRCGRVWLLVEEAGRGYQDADNRFRGRLRDDDPGKRRPRPGAART